MVWGQSDNGPLTVTAPHLSELLTDLGARLKAKQGFSVATLNLDHVVKLRNNAEFRTAYAAHSHITADGNPIVWLSRLAGQNVALIPGSELIEPLVALAAKHNVPIYPGLEVAFCRSPEMGFDPDGSTATADMNALSASGARLCFIALGAPKQERLAVRAQTLHPQIGFVSIGAGLNFIAGTEKRAPKWIRAIAAEWIWRMLADPKRLIGRYASCLLAMPGLTLKAIRAQGLVYDSLGRADNLAVRWHFSFSKI